MNIATNLKAIILKYISQKNNINFDIKNSKKVLMFRYDRIGDMIITTPVFRELKKYYPNIEINILASKSNHIILKNNPYVDKVYLNSKNNLFFDLPILFKLRREKIDVCFEFDHSVVRHAIIRLKIINPKKVISVQKEGRYGVNALDLTIYTNYTEKLKNAHFRDIWLNMLKAFNIKTDENHYDIFIDRQDDLVASDFVRKYKNKFLIGINLKGAVKGKLIEYQELKEICKGLYSINNNIHIIIINTPDSEEIVKKEIFNMHLKYVSKSYKTNNILSVSALVKNLNMIITPDTAIAHVASAFNKPVITVHENNYESYKLFAPTSDLNRTIFSENHNNLQGFSVKSLLNAADEIMVIKKSE